jgi:tropomyosin
LHRSIALHLFSSIYNRCVTLQLNQTLLERDQEIASLQHKLQLAESEVEQSENKIKQLKSASEEGETHRTTGENLARKVQLLEEELDKAEKDLKETTEK